MSITVEIVGKPYLHEARRGANRWPLEVRRLIALKIIVILTRPPSLRVFLLVGRSAFGRCVSDTIVTSIIADCAFTACL